MRVVGGVRVGPEQVLVHVVDFVVVGIVLRVLVEVAEVEQLPPVGQSVVVAVGCSADFRTPDKPFVSDEVLDIVVYADVFHLCRSLARDASVCLIDEGLARSIALRRGRAVLECLAEVVEVCVDDSLTANLDNQVVHLDVDGICRITDDNRRLASHKVCKSPVCLGVFFRILLVCV